MAKTFFPDWFDGISGKFGNAVFIRKPRILPVRGEEAGGYMRRFVYALAQGALPTNIKASFSIVAAEWKLLTGSEQITWNDEAALLSSTLGYDLSGRSVFFSYFLTKLTHGLSVYFNPAILGAGTDGIYANRETRQFTSNIV